MILDVLANLLCALRIEDSLNFIGVVFALRRDVAYLLEPLGVHGEQVQIEPLLFQYVGGHCKLSHACPPSSLFDFLRLHLAQRNWRLCALDGPPSDAGTT